MKTVCGAGRVALQPPVEQHAAPLRHVHLHPSSDEQLVPVAQMTAREAGQRRRALGAEDEERFDLARAESVIKC